jgi:anti-anti-sigma factor
MSAMALLSPTATHRSSTTNEAVTCGCRGTLSWAVHPRGHLVRITLRGELDAASAPALDLHVRPLAEAGRDLVVDLAGLRFCDCAGLTLFLRWQSRAAAAGGSLRLTAPSRIARRLLILTDTFDLLTHADRGR